jgi:hypothetical protein
MASAAVALWVTSLCPAVPATEAAARLASGLFLQPWQLKAGVRVVPAAAAAGATTHDQEPSALAKSQVAQEIGALEYELQHMGTSLAQQVALFTDVGEAGAKHADTG